MINMTKINKKLLLIINILIGLLIVGFIFYCRILIIRLPKDLWIFDNNIINYFFLLKIILGILLSFYQIVKNIFYNIIY